MDLDVVSLEYVQAISMYLRALTATDDLERLKQYRDWYSAVKPLVSFSLLTCRVQPRVD